MKNNRTTAVEVRLTPEEKELIKDYCGKRKINMSVLIRDTVFRFIKEETKDEP